MTTPVDLIITPATWRENTPNLQQTTTGLYNLVGWFGSTHSAATWRKDQALLSVFKDKHTPGFDPQVSDWDPSYTQIEAEVLATAAVIVIRLENNELLNGSLGSIAEIGLALTSAALRGQIVIVSIEEGMLTSLNEPGAIAQYMMLEMSLEIIEKMASLKGLLAIHRGDNLAKLAELCCAAARHQMRASHQGIDFDQFLQKKARRHQNYPRRVLLGGSGGPYDEEHDAIFRRKRDSLSEGYLSDGQPVKILSEGAIAKAWQIPYGSVDNLGIALATRTLLAIENEFKREADVLLLPIMAESASKAAATEIGFLLLFALTTGQEVKVYAEPFDPVDFIRCQLDDVDIQPITTEKEMRRALRRAGVASDILAEAIKDEVLDTFELFKALTRGDHPGYKQVKASLLGQTGVFSNADNIRRVRALVEAHLENLHQDSRFAGFFDYSTEVKP